MAPDFDVPACAALLIIDMQRDFCEPGGYAAACGLESARLRAPVPVIARLRAAAHAAGVAVFYTREGHGPDLADCPASKQARSLAAGAEIGARGALGRYLVRGEPGHAIVAELTPAASEPVIDKPGYGAFYRTGLAARLARRGIRRLVLTGVTTDVCVQSTLREAVDRGFDCITVADACAAANAAIHRASLGLIEGPEGSILGRVWPARRLLEAWSPAAPRPRSLA